MIRQDLDLAWSVTRSNREIPVWDATHRPWITGPCLCSHSGRSMGSGFRGRAEQRTNDAFPVICRTSVGPDFWVIGMDLRRG